MRRRLVVLAAATTTMVALAFLVPLAVLVRTLARDRALTAAELEAQSLAPALALTQDPGALETAVRATTAGAQNRLTIFLPDGRLVGRIPENVVEHDNLDLARRGRAFSAPVEEGVEVLVPVALGGGTAVVRVLVPRAALDRGVASAWAVEFGVGIVLVAVAVLLADRMARTIVRPVRALAGAAQRLGEGDLSVRIKAEGPPEVAQVGVAFNRLGLRLGELLAAERELIADLSHRLRTPLTALRLDAEGLADAETTQRLMEDIDALERAVNAMIRQARRPVRHDMAPLADAARVAADRLAFWTPLAEDQGRAFALAVAGDGAEPAALGSAGAPRATSSPDQHTVAVTVDELEAAVDALLGNVFAHTPEGTPFRIEVLPRDGGGTCLVVEDAGPGLSADFVARGASGAGSTGLGLDIARRTAEAAGGCLRIDGTTAGGARVVLEFPPAPSTTP